MISRLAKTLLAGCVLLSFAGVADAREKQIKCPRQQAERKIVNKLPDGWWTTPIVARLSQTKVMNVGGEPTLLCIYGNAGSVQRKAPRKMTCLAVTGGFTCTNS